MAFAFPSFFHAVSSFFQAQEKIPCFHCDEKMKKNNALMAVFNGESHPVCCHGCLAVLQTIERNGLVSQYLLTKVPASESAGSV
ncbi:hypothetical protein EJG51_002105 [Undibacterium piscinae]|jgi:hypothetical protein|uniref:Putative metal-binding domain-containing protein n=1 Tax=Undibacterium piscinae TaxID=2495591 RepID=A0A6M4A121_9BURK|nr:hypothetical protein EJG51_002105 [Undibacterium piscinae]